MGESLGLLVAFSAGLFSFLSPCVLSLFPSYLSFITGMSVDRLASDVAAGERTRVLLHSAAFIAGFTAVFVSPAPPSARRASSCSTTATGSASRAAPSS